MFYLEFCSPNLIRLCRKNRMEEFSSYYDAVSKIIEAYDTTPSKADEIMSEQFSLSVKQKPFLSVCQFIFLTVLRNKFLIECSIGKIAPKKPRKKVFALLKGACAEIMTSDAQKLPKVVHGWVEFSKKYLSFGEAKFVNAVLRKLSGALEETKKENKLDIIYSVPQWLLERWKANFGSEKTLEMLQIINEPSKVFLRKSPNPEADRLLEQNAAALQKSQFDDFYILNSGCWNVAEELLRSGLFYIQDPSTTFAVNRLEPKSGGKYLDLCASPGGKSRYIADKILEETLKNDESKVLLKDSLLVSVDVKERIKKLRQNIARIDFLDTKILECNLLEENLGEKLADLNLPLLFDGVFIDAPCSNTGVLRRRPDARYRISEEDISNCAKIQRLLLNKNCRFVKVGGRLVFSTCSIDHQENEENAAAFAKENPQFVLEYGKTFLPDIQNDGCGVFVFKRIY